MQTSPTRVATLARAWEGIRYWFNPTLCERGYDGWLLSVTKRQPALFIRIDVFLARVPVTRLLRDTLARVRTTMLHFCRRRYRGTPDSGPGCCRGGVTARADVPHRVLRLRSPSGPPARGRRRLRASGSSGGITGRIAAPPDSLRLPNMACLPTGAHLACS